MSERNVMAAQKRAAKKSASTRKKAARKKAPARKKSTARKKAPRKAGDLAKQIVKDVKPLTLKQRTDQAVATVLEHISPAALKKTTPATIRSQVRESLKKNSVWTGEQAAAHYLKDRSLKPGVGLKATMGPGEADSLLEMQALEQRITKIRSKRLDTEEQIGDLKSTVKGLQAEENALAGEVMQLIRDLRTGQGRLAFELKDDKPRKKK